MYLMEIGCEDGSGWNWLRSCPVVGFRISGVETSGSMHEN
jgi:hypothetical protein